MQEHPSEPLKTALDQTMRCIDLSLRVFVTILQ